MPISTVLDPLPPAPSRADPANFAARGDAFLAALVTLRTQINSAITELNALSLGQRSADGTALAPGMSFQADTDTGFYRYNTNTIGVSAGGAVAMVIDGSQNVGIGTVTPGKRLDVRAVGANAALRLVETASFGISWDINVGSSNRMLFTNNSPSDLAYAFDKGGLELIGAGGKRTISWTMYGSPRSAFLEIDGAVNGTQLIIGSNNAARLTIGSTGIIVPGADNAQTFGSAALRWSTIFAATGTINTSDARAKTPVAQLTPAEVAAACELAREIGTFQFLDSVERKGTAARQHVGITVQRAMEVMVDHGLDPLRYAFICHDTWPEKKHPATTRTVPAATRLIPAVIAHRPAVLDDAGAVVTEAFDEEIEPARVEVVTPEQTIEDEPEWIEPAGDSYGFRSEQLAFFIARGLAARQDAFEARLAALEGGGAAGAPA